MHSRREFLTALGAFALSPALFAERTTPELILFNGNFITVDQHNPRAQAVAIADERFLAVGTNDEVRALATGATKKIDLAGRTVVPGFIDAHTHPAVAGRMHLRQVDCDLRSIDAIKTPSTNAPPKLRLTSGWSVSNTTTPRRAMAGR